MQCRKTSAPTEVPGYTQRRGLLEFQALIPGFSGILVVLIEKRLADLNERRWLSLTTGTGKSMAKTVKVGTLIGKGDVAVADPDEGVVAYVKWQGEVGAVQRAGNRNG